jgi:DNA polymerase
VSVLRIDFETASTCDLKRAGAWVYSLHPDTRVLCMAWAFDDETVCVWRPGQIFPQRVTDHVKAGGEVHAWNALFEFCIWNNALWRALISLPKVTLTQLHCTMACAAYYGLPMSLDMAGPASGAGVHKDKIGHALMLRMSRPRSTKPAVTWWHETDHIKYDRLCLYCADDVRTERAVAGTLPPLPASERLVWLMDARMNMRGLMIDRPLVVRLMDIADAEVARLSQELAVVTGGAVTSVTKTEALKVWLRNLGHSQVDSLAKDSMGDLLNDVTIQGNARKALLIRQEAAKTSTAKLQSMLDCSDPYDDRVRGLVMHYGATRTGRWAGRLVQVQNLPRPVRGVRVELFIQHVQQGMDVETLRFVHGNLLDAVSSSLRGCFMAAPGMGFAVCDYSAVEARVIAWLAGQTDLLDVFRRGEDVYLYTAAKIGSVDRTLGKVATLGLGFGMGWVKFIESALTYGLTLTAELAQAVVQAWRQANRKIVAFWYDLEQAVRDAIESHHETKVGAVTVRMGRGLMTGHLLIWLPSGRPLVYRNARLETVNGRSQITYDGLDQYTRQWTAIRTYGGKLAENVTQAVARDLLADAMLETEADNLPIVASIHDEELVEVPADEIQSAFLAMQGLMSTSPAWAPGLPLGGAGWTGQRYGKG